MKRGEGTTSIKIPMEDYIYQLLIYRIIIKNNNKCKSVNTYRKSKITDEYKLSIEFLIEFEDIFEKILGKKEKYEKSWGIKKEKLKKKSIGIQEGGLLQIVKPEVAPLKLKVTKIL